MRRNRDYAPHYTDPEVEEKFYAFLLAACDDFTALGDHRGLWRDAQIRFEEDSA